ncbi:hypothetical protein H1C71_030808, partial [Ictidomys tridecemlineatus]
MLCSRLYLVLVVAHIHDSLMLLVKAQDSSPTWNDSEDSFYHQNSLQGMLKHSINSSLKLNFFFYSFLLIFLPQVLIPGTFLNSPLTSESASQGIQSVTMLHTCYILSIYLS